MNPDDKGHDKKPDEQSEQAVTTSFGDAATGVAERLRVTFSEKLETVGLAVFSMTALAIIVFILIFNLFFDEPADLYPSLRSTELLLKLAATGLVIALVGRAQNAFVLAFGIFLIGALIVPSNDLIRFAIIVTGSDRTLEQEAGAGPAGADLQGRATDVANKILTELARAGLTYSLAEDERKRASDIIAEQVVVEREITLLEQVRGRGAFDVLQQVQVGIREWIYKYGGDEKFLDDLRFLRSEGLIRFVYEDLDTVASTALGLAVLNRADVVATSGGTRASDGGRPLYPLLSEEPAYGDEDYCPPDVFRAHDVTADLASPSGLTVDLRSDPIYRRFIITEPADYYQIDVERSNDGDDNGNFVDPWVELYELTTDSTCSYINGDDDGGDGLNSRLFQYFESGNYVIGVSSIGAEGQANVSVRPEITVE